MTLEIVTNTSDMTITVGSKTFAEPYLWKTPEWNYDLKQEISPHPNVHSLPMKDRNKFFCEQLGPKFNLRFVAANYHLWLGDRFTRRTANMLRIGGNSGWRVYSKDLVIKANEARAHVQRAEEDGLFHLVPAIVIFGSDPQGIRKEVGPATWRRIASNSQTRNMRLMQRAQYINNDVKSDFVSLLDFPSGVLLGVQSINDESKVASRLATRKTRQGYEQTFHVVRDAMRMIGADFNKDWSLKRITEEHDKAVTAQRTKTYSDKRFAADWAWERDNFRAELLTSPLAIAVEGGTQHHCVGSYWREARDGGYAVFKVTGKERATIGAYKREGAWILDQVYGACNAPVSVSCRDFAYKVSDEFKGYTR